MGFQVASDELIFSRDTNTDGGGFSSIRTHPLQLDLSDRSGIRVKVKGDGRRYTWHLQTDARWRGLSVGYWADFNTSTDEVVSVDIPFTVSFHSLGVLNLMVPNLAHDKLLN